MKRTVIAAAVLGATIVVAALVGGLHTSVSASSPDTPSVMHVLFGSVTFPEKR